MWADYIIDTIKNKYGGRYMKSANGINLTMLCDFYELTGSPGKMGVPSGTAQISPVKRKFLR